MRGRSVSARILLCTFTAMPLLRALPFYKKRSPRWNLKKQLGIVTLAFGRSMPHVLDNFGVARGSLKLKGKLLLFIPLLVIIARGMYIVLSFIEGRNLNFMICGVAFLDSIEGLVSWDSDSPDEARHPTLCNNIANIA